MTYRPEMAQRPAPFSRRRRLIPAILTLLALFIHAPAVGQSRIKDIVYFEGVRSNQLVGYGLVVGLNGTGDSLGSAIFTRESLIGMLERLGVNARDDALTTDNVAAVMVTATLPPFTHQGSNIDVTVSALGDADNLLGGTLLVTPLVGADGEIYAVAQGTIAVGGFAAGGAAEVVVKGVPTSGRIANGAIIEREIPFQLANRTQIKLALRNPDFTTARRIARAINAFVGLPTAQASDPATVVMKTPDSYKGEIIELITDIEQLRVETDQIAKVVIDEQSGTIVMGENVRINPVAIAQGALTIRVTETPQVSQPLPFSNTGTTEVVPRTEITIDEGEDRKLTVLNTGVSLQELVNSLNALGIGPRDMITILQAIKAAGALNADIQVL
ncbi:MAG: flagellar basal body P-ring protein FlgI [Alphaproteobacteria bacterium]